MLREPNEGWGSPPSNDPPRPETPHDYVHIELEDDPYAPMHPIRKGLAAVWVVFGLLLASPLLIAATVAYFWWEVLLWLTRER